MIDTPTASTVIVTIGSSYTLSCTSSGSPPDTFTWMKDGDPTVLQSTNVTAVNHTSTSAVFRADYVIDNIAESDIGTYTCTVINPIGSDNATITVVTRKMLMWCMTTKDIHNYSILNMVKGYIRVVARSLQLVRPGLTLSTM